MTDAMPTPDRFIQVGTQRINPDDLFDPTAAQRRPAVEQIAREIAAALDATPSGDSDLVEGQIMLKTDVLTLELLELHKQARRVGQRLGEVSAFVREHCPMDGNDDEGRRNWRELVGLTRCEALATLAAHEILVPTGQEPDITEELAGYGHLVEPEASDIDHAARARTAADRSPAIEAIAADLARRQGRLADESEHMAEASAIAEELLDMARRARRIAPRFEATRDKLGKMSEGEVEFNDARYQLLGGEQIDDLATLAVLPILDAMQVVYPASESYLEQIKARYAPLLSDDA